MFDLPIQFRECVFAAVFENTLDGALQIPQAFLPGHPLAMRFGNFRTGGEQILLPLLENRGEPEFHVWTLTNFNRACNPSALRLPARRFAAWEAARTRLRWCFPVRMRRRSTGLAPGFVAESLCESSTSLNPVDFEAGTTHPFRVILRRWLLRFLGVGVCLLFSALRAALPPASVPDPLYEFRPGTPDGLGKWFLGREIAHYMSHQGAEWLERPEREEEEKTSRVLPALGLKPGDRVADVGAGSGYFSWRMAKAVGPTGAVYANDIQPEMLAILSTNVAARGVTNVLPVLGSLTDPKLPTHALDLVLMVDVYHEFDHPYEMMQGIVRSLKPGGRVVLVEYRGEEKWVPIKPLHKMTEAQVKSELALHPLEWVETLKVLPRQHILVFRRRAD